jgi:hypothetical protein
LGPATSGITVVSKSHLYEKPALQMPDKEAKRGQQAQKGILRQFLTLQVDEQNSDCRHSSD